MTSLIPFYTNRNRSLDRTNDSFFDDPFFRSFFQAGELAGAGVMRVDVQDLGDSYLMEVDLPGVKQSDLDISVEDDVLTVSADMNVEKKEEKKNYIFNERRVGRFQRRFNLEGIRQDSITAEFSDGVLKLTMPKLQPEPKPAARKIEIH